MEKSRRDLLTALALGPLGLALSSAAAAQSAGAQSGVSAPGNGSAQAAGPQSQAAQPASRSVWPTRPSGSIASRTFPNVQVISQDGMKHRFYDDLIKDKIVMINFFYSECKEFCPPMIANLARVQNELGARLGKDVFMYSLTLEPKHDTPEVLNQYARMYHAKPGWMFLTGKPEDLELLRVKLGFRDSDPELDKDRTQHTGVIRYGNDKLNRWSACPALASLDEIMRELDSLNPSPRRFPG